MSNASRIERGEVIHSGSPLGKHSLNQRRVRYESQGEVRVFGESARRVAAKTARANDQSERLQILKNSANNLLEGNVTEIDIVSFFSLAPEFEEIIEIGNENVLATQIVSPKD